MITEKQKEAVKELCQYTWITFVRKTILVPL